MSDKPKRRQTLDETVAGLMDGSMPAGPRSSTGRKKRKDATGQKPDYHKGTEMLGVRLPDDVTAEVRRRAADEGVSVNAWLKALVFAALELDE